MIIKLILFFLFSLSTIFINSVSKFCSSIANAPKFFLNVTILKFLNFDPLSKLIEIKVSFVTDLPSNEDINSVFLNIRSIKGIRKEKRTKLLLYKLLNLKTKKETNM